MKTRTIIILVISWSVFAMASTCEYEPEEVTFVVYGQGGNFSGEYILDNQAEAYYFQGEETSSGIFKYSQLVAIEESILVNIFPEPTDDADDDNDESDMSDVTFRVLDEDGDIVYETSYAIYSTLMKTFEFDLDEQTYDDDPYADENQE